MVCRFRSAAVGVHGRRDAVRGEHHDGALGHLVGLLDEDRTGLGQGVHHVPVVHDLVPDVDRRAVLFQRTFDRLDGPVDAGAVATRLGQQHPLAGRPARLPSWRHRESPCSTVGGMTSRVLSADTGSPARALSLELAAG